MRHFRNLALVAMIAAIGACSESAVSPTHEQRVITGDPANMALSQNDTLRFSFTVLPQYTTSASLGQGNWIVFPPSSICDPVTSGYGPEYWDESCQPKTDSTVVSVQAWLDADGHPNLDFSPALRFVPSDSQSVLIRMADQTADPNLKILYCHNFADSTCVDEAATDSSLMTQQDASGGYFRRIRHFSGYNVGAGSDSTGVDVGVTLYFNRTAGGAPSLETSTLSGYSPIRPLVSGVLRRTPLTVAQSAAALITPERGGILTLDATGLRVLVPPGAVTSPVTLSVSARLGSAIAYDFEPHGLRFARGVTVQQNLVGTDWIRHILRGIQGAYFATDNQVDMNSGAAVVDEMLNSRLDFFRAQMQFTIHHLSGYMVCSG